MPHATSTVERSSRHGDGRHAADDTFLLQPAIYLLETASIFAAISPAICWNQRRPHRRRVFLLEPVYAFAGTTLSFCYNPSFVATIKNGSLPAESFCWNQRLFLLELVFFCYNQSLKLSVLSLILLETISFFCWNLIMICSNRPTEILLLFWIVFLLDTMVQGDDLDEPKAWLRWGCSNDAPRALDLTFFRVTSMVNRA